MLSAISPGDSIYNSHASYKKISEIERLKKIKYKNNSILPYIKNKKIKFNSPNTSRQKNISYKIKNNFSSFIQNKINNNNIYDEINNLNKNNCLYLEYKDSIDNNNEEIKNKTYIRINPTKIIKSLNLFSTKFSDKIHEKIIRNFNQNKIENITYDIGIKSIINNNNKNFENSGDKKFEKIFKESQFSINKIFFFDIIKKVRKKMEENKIIKNMKITKGEIMQEFKSQINLLNTFFNFNLNSQNKRTKSEYNNNIFMKGKNSTKGNITSIENENFGHSFNSFSKYESKIMRFNEIKNNFENYENIRKLFIVNLELKSSKSLYNSMINIHSSNPHEINKNKNIYKNTNINQNKNFTQSINLENKLGGLKKEIFNKKNKEINVDLIYKINKNNYIFDISSNLKFIDFNSVLSEIDKQINESKSKKRYLISFILSDESILKQLKFGNWNPLYKDKLKKIENNKIISININSEKKVQKNIVNNIEKKFCEKFNKEKRFVKINKKNKFKNNFIKKFSFDKIYKRNSFSDNINNYKENEKCLSYQSIIQTLTNYNEYSDFSNSIDYEFDKDIKIKREKSDKLDNEIPVLKINNGIKLNKENSDNIYYKSIINKEEIKIKSNKKFNLNYFELKENLKENNISKIKKIIKNEIQRRIPINIHNINNDNKNNENNNKIFNNHKKTKKENLNRMEKKSKIYKSKKFNKYFGKKTKNIFKKKKYLNDFNSKNIKVNKLNNNSFQENNLNKNFFQNFNIIKDIKDNLQEINNSNTIKLKEEKKINKRKINLNYNKEDLSKRSFNELMNQKNNYFNIYENNNQITKVKYSLTEPKKLKSSKNKIVLSSEILYHSFSHKFYYKNSSKKNNDNILIKNNKSISFFPDNNSSNILLLNPTLNGQLNLNENKSKLISITNTSINEQIKNKNSNNNTININHNKNVDNNTNKNDIFKNDLNYSKFNKISNDFMAKIKKNLNKKKVKKISDLFSQLFFKETKNLNNNKYNNSDEDNYYSRNHIKNKFIKKIKKNKIGFHKFMELMKVNDKLINNNINENNNEKNIKSEIDKRKKSTNLEEKYKLFKELIDKMKSMSEDEINKDKGIDLLKKDNPYSNKNINILSSFEKEKIEKRINYFKKFLKNSYDKRVLNNDFNNSNITFKSPCVFSTGNIFQ